MRLLIIFLSISISSSCQLTKKEAGEENTINFKDLLVQIREERISPENAEVRFAEIMANLKEKYPSPPYDSLKMDLVFPLRKKNYRSVGGKGRGFFGRHFDLFDHSVAKSHPAHDIFIYDIDHDCREDTNNEYVDVLAVNDGVVIATETAWSKETGYKGGNFVWLYDFVSGGVWYYAHQRKIIVVEDQIVQQGDILGQVGRSGFNAKTNRSDTHLHLMFLKLDQNFRPTAVDHYPWLKKARTVYESHVSTHFPRKTLNAYMMVKPSFKFFSTSFKDLKLN
ncbi:MAG: murein DD-endopeptidase MepM/ murein hydrolase activator NlpD [Psychromonas sp.]